MPNRVKELGELLGRGIYKAPWCGPGCEWVLLVVKTDHTLVLPPIHVPEGTSLPELYDHLHNVLDHLDPPAKHAVLGLISSSDPA